VAGVVFEQGWFALVDGDQGGLGNFANEPSPDTVAYIRSRSSSQGDSRITFPRAVIKVSFYHSLFTDVGKPIVYFFDSNGSLLGTQTMDVCGDVSCGNTCVGDPTGQLCGWSLITFQHDDIAYIEFDPIANGFWAVDNVAITGELSEDYGYPVAPYLPGSYAKRTFFKNQDHLGEDEKLVVKTPVRAIGPGKIVKYGPATGYGELVAVVEHDLGKVHEFKTHMGIESARGTYFLFMGISALCSGGMLNPPIGAAFQSAALSMNATPGRSLRIPSTLQLNIAHIRKSAQRGGAGTGLKVGDSVTKDTILGYINNSSHPDGLTVDPNGDGLEHLHFGIRLSSAATAKCFALS